MPYLAGLYLYPARLDAIAAGTVSISVLVNARVFKKGADIAKRDAGRVKSMPKSWLGLGSLYIGGTAILLPPFGYLATIIINGVFGKGLEQPAWLKAFSLPDLQDGQTTALIRASSCIAFLGGMLLGVKVVQTLGAQLHPMGVRERPKLVTSGPYTVLRHPMYTVILLKQLLLGLMTWNYIPLVALATITVALIIKIPYEEELMEEHPDLGAQYEEYKRRVRWSVIPYIW